MLSPLVYPNLAPPTWHNVTPHGSIVLNSFAVSTDDPGLAFACGSQFTLGWTQPWSIGSMRYWRSTDGGAHWQMIQPPFQQFAPPFQSNQYCDLSMPPDGHGTILVTLSSSSDVNGPVTVWMSQDAGNSWQQVESGGPSENSVYRNGVLYDTTNLGGSGAFAVSTDDGVTWTVQVPSPDQLVKDGWHVDSMVPDYRFQHWWYRELSRAGSVSVLNIRRIMALPGRWSDRSARLCASPTQSISPLGGPSCDCHTSDESPDGSDRHCRQAAPESKGGACGHAATLT